MSFTTNQSTALSTYYVLPWLPCQIRATDINKTIKDTVVTLGLERFGFSKSNISSHSLRAGGAMAMKLNGVDSITIKKHGRWSSNTFLEYIHQQIGAFTVGLASKMSAYIPFSNMNTGPTLVDPEDFTNTPS